MLGTMAKTITVHDLANSDMAYLLEALPDAIVIVNQAGQVVNVNGQAEDLFGYAREEILGQPLEMLLPERFRGQHLASRREYLHKPLVRPMGAGLDLYARHKDGSEFPVEISLSPVTTNEGILVISSIRDITARKQVEEALRELSGRLISAQEEERARIARELHDSVSQKLALLAVDLDIASQKQSRTESPFAKQLRKLVERTRDISAEIHNLSYQLHPSQLAHVGLDTAIKRLCMEITEQSRTVIECCAHMDGKFLPSDIALCLYRVTQEALQNVVRHGNARDAQVELTASSTMVTLRISDSGVGFDTAAAIMKGRLGLLSMRERTHLVGGTISIQSKPSEGTCIDVKIPVPSSAE
jgi:PAS domain S-box-containing protein